MRENRPWVIWLTLIAIILAGVGVFFYYTLFRQEKSELIEAIPTDAAFIFALNDNDGFVTSTTKVAPYLNELFVLDALPAFETMRGKLPAGEYDLTVSGHADEDGVSILFNMHADKAAFQTAPARAQHRSQQLHRVRGQPHLHLRHQLQKREVRLCEPHHLPLHGH